MSTPAFPGPWNGAMYQYFVDLNQAMSSVGHLYINIYTDPSGNNYANDNHGHPITNRLVIYMMYTFSKYEVSWSQADVSTFRIVFDDLSRFEFPDDEIIRWWYSIEGVTPIEIKPLT